MTSSEQAAHPSLPRKRESSLISLLLLSPKSLWLFGDPMTRERSSLGRKTGVAACGRGRADRIMRLAHWTPAKHRAPHPSAWAGVKFPWSRSRRPSVFCPFRNNDFLRKGIYHARKKMLPARPAQRNNPWMKRRPIASAIGRLLLSPFFRKNARTPWAVSSCG